MDNLDLVTPNRLKFGRNNDMAPVGPMLITNDPKRLLRNSAELFKVWWDSWLDVAIPKLFEKDQGGKLNRNLQAGDVAVSYTHLTLPTKRIV